MTSYYNQLLTEIKKRVACRPERQPVPWDTHNLEVHFSRLKQTSFDFGRSHYSLDEFARFFDEELVVVAYMTILGRPPNECDFSKSMEALVSHKFSRVSLLEALCLTPEGKKMKVKIAGLRVRARIERLTHFPVIGPMVKFVVALVRLPNIFLKLNTLERQIYQQSKEFDRKISALISRHEIAIAEISEKSPTQSDSAIRENGQAERDNR